MKALYKNGVKSAQAGEYVFDNAEKNAEERYRTLSSLYDVNTVRHLKNRGVQEGWSCLEVGGGGGSIAYWLCLRVGPAGRVLATDIDPTFLERLSFPKLEVCRHDIRHESLPTSQFDLAHVRLVLMHLPEPEIALKRIINALIPGGRIVVEEFDALSLLPDPDLYPGEVSLKLRQAFHDVLTARGVDLRFGRSLPQKLQSLGLVNIGVEASASLWGTNSAGASHLKLSFRELHEPMVLCGLISQEEYDADLDRIDDQDFLMPSPMMWTAWGTKPGSTFSEPAGSQQFVYW